MAIPSIPSGSISIFVQPTAPVGWTKLTTIDDAALRIVSGTVSDGGVSNFSTVFTDKSLTSPTSGTSTIPFSGAMSPTTLSSFSMASHRHLSWGLSASGGNNPRTQFSSPGSGRSSLALFLGPGSVSAGPAGGGGSHAHTLSVSGGVDLSPTVLQLSLRYVDAIVAQRN
jgi:hypothetical protein